MGTSDREAASREVDDLPTRRSIETPTSRPPQNGHRTRAIMLVGILALVGLGALVATLLPGDTRDALLGLRHDAHFVMRPLRSDSYGLSADGLSFAVAITIEMIGTSVLIMIVIGWLEQRRRQRVPSRSGGRAVASRRPPPRGR